MESTHDERSIGDHYRDAFEAFVENIKRANTIAYGGSFQKTEHPRQFYCHLIFTKMVVMSRSLLRLCPHPEKQSRVHDHWDLPSCAAISRSITDAFAIHFHLGVEEVDDDEHEARRLVTYWRDFTVRDVLFVERRSERQSEYKAFHERDLRARLDANAYWGTLRISKRRHILKKRLLIHDQNEIFERAGFDPDDVAKTYRYLSAQMHCDSISFMRMAEQRRGVGLENDADKAGIFWALANASELLVAASSNVDRVLPGSEARGMSVEATDRLNGVFPRPPWASKEQWSQYSSESTD